MRKGARRGSIKWLYIDGYNLMNSWSSLKDISTENLEEGRNTLNEILVEYAAYSGEITTVVYDAYMVKNTASRKKEYKGLNIVFTKEHQTADSYIEKEVAEKASDRRNSIRVVTSDSAEQMMILGSGATRVSGREFYFEVENMGKNIEKKENKSQGERVLLGDRIDSETLRILDKWRKI